MKWKRAVMKYIKNIKLVEWEPVFCSKIYSDTEEFSKNCFQNFSTFIKIFVHTRFFSKQKITVQRVSSRTARVSSRIPRNRNCPKLAVYNILNPMKIFRKFIKFESKIF